MVKMINVLLGELYGNKKLNPFSPVLLLWSTAPLSLTWTMEILTFDLVPACFLHTPAWLLAPLIYFTPEIVDFFNTMNIHQAVSLK